MIAVDTNILVFAHRRDAKWHAEAASVMQQLAEGPSPWAIPWPCVHEFISVVTNPRIYRPPTPLPLAFEQVDAWLQSPSIAILSETDGHLTTLREISEPAKLAGPEIHDARIAALCLDHGASVLWSADRDFLRFPALRVLNPLLMHE